MHSFSWVGKVEQINQNQQIIHSEIYFCDLSCPEW